MKKIMRVLVLAIIMVLCTTAFTPALAASKTYKGTCSQTYTITTGKKDAKLTVENKKGKIRMVGKEYFGNKTKKKDVSGYAKFSVEISDGWSTTTKTLECDADNKKFTYTLKKNKTYTITVTYIGYSYQVKTAPGILVQSQSWKKDPSVKVKVNNSAKIYAR